MPCERVERPVINVEEDSAGLRREYPLVDAAKLPTKNEKPESVESVSDSEEGLVEVSDRPELSRRLEQGSPLKLRRSPAF